MILAPIAVWRKTRWAKPMATLSSTVSDTATHSYTYIHISYTYIYTIYSAHTLHAIYVFFIHFNSLIYCILFVCMNKWKTKRTDRAAVASDVRLASCQFPGRPFFVLIVERLTCDTRLKIALKCCMQISQSAVKSDFLNTSKSSFHFTL